MIINHYKDKLSKFELIIRVNDQGYNFLCLGLGNQSTVALNLDFDDAEFLFNEYFAQYA